MEFQVGVEFFSSNSYGISNGMSQLVVSRANFCFNIHRKIEKSKTINLKWDRDQFQKTQKSVKIHDDDEILA